MATAPKGILHSDNQEQTRIDEAHGEGTWFVYVRSSSVPVEVRRAGVGCGYWMAIPSAEVDEFKTKLEGGDCRVEFDSFELRVAGSIFGSDSKLREIAERKLLELRATEGRCWSRSEDSQSATRSGGCVTHYPDAPASSHGPHPICRAICRDGISTTLFEEDEMMYTIIVTDKDFSRLQALIDSSRLYRKRDQHHVDELEEELNQAQIVPAVSIPNGIVTMYSRVRVTDLDSGKVSEYQLVLPKDADSSRNMISVLAPIGTALLGYAIGSEIEWRVPGGHRRLRIDAVEQEPARSPSAA